MAGMWLMVVAAMLGCSHAQLDLCFPDEVPEVPNPNLPRDISKFSLGLFKKVVTWGETGRLRTREGGHLKINKMGNRASSRSRGAVESTVISPYSVWSALLLAYLGAEGRTRQQLARALKLSSKTSSHANYLFVHQMLVSVFWLAGSDWLIVYIVIQCTFIILYTLDVYTVLLLDTVDHHAIIKFHTQSLIEDHGSLEY